MITDEMIEAVAESMRGVSVTGGPMNKPYIMAHRDHSLAKAAIEAVYPLIRAQVLI